MSVDWLLLGLALKCHVCESENSICNDEEPNGEAVEFTEIGSNKTMPCELCLFGMNEKDTKVIRHCTGEEKLVQFVGNISNLEIVNFDYLCMRNPPKLKGQKNLPPPEDIFNYVRFVHFSAEPDQDF